MTRRTAMILVVLAVLCGADAPRRTFDDLIDRHIGRDEHGYFTIPRGPAARRAWMLERARALRGNAEAVIYALEHGALRQPTRRALIDSGAIAREMLRADRAGRGRR